MAKKKRDLQNMNQINYRRGIIPLAVLLLLNSRELYGYELVQEMERITEGSIVALEGSLYPILYRLEEAGYVTNEKRQAGKRMMRVYYNITPSGREHLRELVRDYKAVNNGMFRLIELGGMSDE